MNAKNAIRASMVALLMVSAIACQKSDDKKDNNSDAPTVVRKNTPEETKAVRAAAEAALLDVGYRFKEPEIEVTAEGQQKYVAKAAWDTKYYKKFLELNKSYNGQMPTRQQQMDALNTYIAGMETYISDNGGVPAPTPSVESPEAQTPEVKDDMKDAKADKEETQPSNEDKASDKESDKGSEPSQDKQAPVAEEVVIEGELAMLQARVELAKARLAKMQAREEKKKQQAPEQKGESKDEGKDQPAPAPSEPEATEPKAEPTPAPEAPKA